MSDLPSLAASLREHDLIARKGLGQHFLLDPSINARIASQAGDVKGRAVLEIGPGPGGLTRALLNVGAAPLIAIEKDTRFLPMLTPLIAWSRGRLQIVEEDALDVDEANLLAAAHAQLPATIVSNLPYNVATPLLVKWLKADTNWRGEMILMFQKEVAQRIVAKPRDNAYGRLSVLAQAVCDTEIVMTLPPGAFAPPPKVDSAVVRLTTLPQPYTRLDALERVTAAAFGQRRKMLRASLRKLTPEVETRLIACGVAPTARAEELSVADFIRLTEVLAPAQ
jgi:16S rRNA (adenine1518-N6/adenine1519-N6)-dimethyltransferase